VALADEMTNRPARGDRSFQVTGDGSDRWKIYWDSCQMASLDSRDLAKTHLVATVNRVVLDQVDLLAAHAGVVRLGSRIIAFPAASGGGKTTLTAALLSRGCQYLSDEALVLDEDGVVVPYPKPLALSQWSCRAVGVEARGIERLMVPADFGSAVARGGPLTDMVVAEYGEKETRIERLPRSTAVTALLGNAFNHYKDPAHAFHLSTQVASAAKVWSLEYQDPLHAAEELIDLLHG
jgi:serine kinase of HPr protein (carbohydrate metabolism regulator)